MRINPSNLRQADQSPYCYSDRELRCDPAALGTFLAISERGLNKAKGCIYTRQYEKAKRLQRIAERAQKDRAKRGE